MVGLCYVPFPRHTQTHTDYVTHNSRCLPSFFLLLLFHVIIAQGHLGVEGERHSHTHRMRETHNRRDRKKKCINLVSLHERKRESKAIKREITKRRAAVGQLVPGIEEGEKDEKLTTLIKKI